VREGAANVLADLGTLASTVYGLSLLLENSGQWQESGDLKRQLDEDVSVLAERFSKSNRREFWAEQFFVGGRQSLHQQNRLRAALDFRLVTLLMPDEAEAHNSLAWAMTSVPNSTPFAITVALDSARKAVELKPEQWIYWNTLGVAAFRAQDWELAAESLERSIELNKPGGAIDFFFLAMTRKHQGQLDEAEKLFKKGETYLQHNPGDPELTAFRHEASRLLHPPAMKSEHKTEPKPEENAKVTPHSQS
jgi:tetratricopeptide (TPR) repeat protein